MNSSRRQAAQKRTSAFVNGENIAQKKTD